MEMVNFNGLGTQPIIVDTNGNDMVGLQPLPLPD
jgi:hypothetical protein